MPARERAAHIIEKVARSYVRFFTIEPYLWEYEPMLASGHFQDSIDPPGKFDVVILILASRLGTPMPERTAVREYRGMDGRTPVTGTEWEFEDALIAARAHGLPHLLVYRSNRDASVSTWDSQSRQAVMGQLEALEAFWSRHFADQGKFIGAFEKFDTLEEFSAKFEKDLRGCVERRIQALQPEPSDSRAKLWPHAPFRGLEAFELEHWPIFFGRDESLGLAMLRLVTNALTGRPFLLVLGASGSGKSSLVRAGMLHELLGPQRVSGAAFLRRTIFRASDARAGEDLFDALARCLTTRDGEGVGLPEMLDHSMPVADLAQHLREASAHPTLPFEMVLERLAADARDRGHMLRFEQAKLILIIDQLEELFTAERVRPEERKNFVRLLAGLARSGRVWVLATMRSDFWHSAGEIPELIQLADAHGRLDLLAPTPAELSQMIRGPAEAAGVDFETSDATGIPLNDQIAEEAAGEPGTLPLLSYLLDQLYKKDVLEAGGSALTYATYHALGGLKGAIATRADAVLAAQPPEVRLALRQVLFALVQLGGSETGVDRPIARRAPLSEFPEGSAKRRLVEALLDPSARLLVADGGDRSATVRLAHETLISEWKTAGNYVAENADALRIRRTLEERHVRWRDLADEAKETRSGIGIRSPLARLRARFGPEHGLLTDLDLTDAQRLLRDYRSDLPPDLIAYVERSIDQDRTQDLRTLRAISGVAVGLLALSIFAGAEWLSARHERDIVQTKAEIAERTTQFMVTLFDRANPETNRGADVTVKQALDAGAATIGKGLEREPEVRAELLTAIGQAYSGLGQYKEAESMFGRARTDQASAAASDDSRLRTLVASGKNEYLAGHYEQAVKFLGPAVDIARRKPSSLGMVSARAMTGLANALVAEGKYAEAIQLCAEALDVEKNRGSTDLAARAYTLNSLGIAYLLSGQFSDAEKPLVEALDLRKSVFNLDHPLTAESMNNLGGLYFHMGRYAEAAAQYRASLPIYEKVYRNDHPELATLLNNLGRTDLLVGRIDDAEPLLRQALTMTENFEGPDHDDLVMPLNSLAMIHAYRGQRDTARGELQRAETIARMRAHSDMLDQVLLNEADLDVQAGDAARAAGRLGESKTLLEAAYPDDMANAWRYAIWDTVNAEVLAMNGDASKAQATLAAAQIVIRQRFGAAGLYTQLAARRGQLIASRN